MATFKEQFERYQKNRSRTSLATVKEAAVCKFKRGQLLKKREVTKYPWNTYHLVLGVVILEGWNSNKLTQYLVKTSNSTIPTMSSKGHYMMADDYHTVEEEYKISLKDTLNNL